MPNAATSAVFVEAATKCRAIDFSSPPRPPSEPSARRARVGHRLQGCKGFGRNDKQRLRRVEVAHRLGKIGAVDIGDKAEVHGAIAIVLERFIGHHRSEIGAANADIHDVADPLAGMAFPYAVADLGGEVGHPVEHGVDRGHDILAVNQNRCSSRGPQRHVQDGPLFRDIDLLSPEHGINPRAQADRFRQI